jgi:hypothetical protein
VSGRVVGVRLGWGAPLGFYAADADDLRPGEVVVVDQDGSVQPGIVVVSPEQVLGEEVPARVTGRARRATPAERDALVRSADTEGARLLRSLSELEEGAG